MPSLQLISQFFWACNDCTKYAGVTQCNSSCKVSRKRRNSNKKSIASCRRHVTLCNLGLQLAMVLKQSMQLLQKVELSSTLCNHFKPERVARQVAKRAGYTLQPTCNLSRNSIANTSCEENCTV